MGPTKVIVKDGAIYDAKTGKLLKDGLTTHEDIRDYADHHYIALPVVNKAMRTLAARRRTHLLFTGCAVRKSQRRSPAPGAMPGLRRDVYSRRRTHGRIGLHSLCVLRP